MDLRVVRRPLLLRGQEMERQLLSRATALKKIAKAGAGHPKMLQ